GNINKTPSMPYDLPLLRVYTLKSDEGRMQHNELMDLVTKFSDRVVALEIDLKQTKKVYGAVYTKFIMKGRKIDEINQDPNISLIQHDAMIQGRYDQDMEFNLDFDAAKEVSNVEKEVSTVEPVSTAGAAVTTASVHVSHARRVSTTDDITLAETLVYIRRSAAKDKGKGIMTESEPIQTKTKLQKEQERLGYEAAMRLEEELDEEERQRMARVHEASQSFTKEEWENIRARVEANEELTQRLQPKERNKYSKVDQAKMLQLRKYSFDELKTLFETTMRRVNTYVPMETEDKGKASELAARSSQAIITDSAEVRSSKRTTKEELDQGSSKRDDLVML
nr:hypothetical protein [Tanacetum cinerariifolium]